MTGRVRVVPPLGMTDARLVAHSVPETDWPEWTASSGYAVGARVRVSALHRIFEAQAVIASGGAAPQADPARWLDIGATNRWRAFDLYANDRTVGPSPLSMRLAPGTRIDTICLFGLRADSVRLVQRSTVGGTVLFDQTVNLSMRIVRTWWEHLTAPFKWRTDYLWPDLQPLVGAEYELVFTRASGVVEVGAVVMGLAVTLGDLRYGFEHTKLGLGEMSRDAVGTLRLEKGNTLSRVRAELEIEKSDVPAAMDLADQVIDAPAVYVLEPDATDAWAPMVTLLGYARELPVRGEMARRALVGLNVEGIKWS
jgi:hypothetical protein